jgi:hypothetical protein
MVGQLGHLSQTAELWKTTAFKISTMAKQKYGSPRPTLERDSLSLERVFLAMEKNRASEQ